MKLPLHDGLPRPPHWWSGAGRRNGSVGPYSPGSGARTRQGSGGRMFCSHCGTRLEAGQRFCMGCGSAVAGPAPDARVTTAAPPPAPAYPVTEVAADSDTTGASAAVAPANRIVMLLGLLVLGLVLAGVVYMIMGTRSDSSRSPITLASLASGSWSCTTSRGEAVDIQVTPPTESGSSGGVTAGDSSVRVSQSGDADVLTLANGLLEAMGEQGSISVSQEGAEDASLSWTVGADRVELVWNDGWDPVTVTCNAP